MCEITFWLLLLFFIVDGYSNKDIRYEWEDSDKKVLLDSKVKQLPQYNLTSYSTLNLTREFVAGKNFL